MIYSYRRAWLWMLSAWLRLGIDPLPSHKVMQKC